MSTTRTTTRTTDRTTNEENTMKMHTADVTTTETVVLVASNENTRPAKGRSVEESLSVLRDPDLFDDGKAIWLTADAVVSVDIERLWAVPHVLSQSTRYRFDADMSGWGWTRLHPNHYGIEVDSFFDHGNGAEAHASQVAWAIAETAIITG